MAFVVIWPLAGSGLLVVNCGRLIRTAVLRPFQRRALQGLDNRLGISQVITLLWIPNISIWTSIGIAQGFREMDGDTTGGWTTVLESTAGAAAVTVFLTVMLARHAAGESQFLWDPTVDIENGIPEIVELQRKNARGYIYSAATASGIAEGIDRGWAGTSPWTLPAILRYSFTSHRKLIWWQLATSILWIALPCAWLGTFGLGWRALLAACSLVAIPIIIVAHHRASSFQYQIWSARYRVLVERLQQSRLDALAQTADGVISRCARWFASLPSKSVR